MVESESAADAIEQMFRHQLEIIHEAQGKRLANSFVLVELIHELERRNVLEKGAMAKRISNLRDSVATDSSAPVRVAIIAELNDILEGVEE